MSEMSVMIIKLPQHEKRDTFYGDEVELDEKGHFTINGYEGVTVLTKAQAVEIGKMLITWGEA